MEVISNLKIYRYWVAEQVFEPGKLNSSTTTHMPYNMLFLYRQCRQQDSVGIGFCQVGEQRKEREDHIVEEFGTAVTLMMDYQI